MFGILKWTAALLVALGLALSGAAAATVGYKAMKTKAKFEDVELDLKDAIVNRGLVIDYEGHLGKMLSRTSEAVGGAAGAGAKSPYRKAKYFQFCSAKLTHEVVSANPLNISICPYVVFVFELESEPGIIHVGYRRPFAGPSAATKKAVDKVEALLLAIVTEAAK
jgi:hypothetical protein